MAISIDRAMLTDAAMRAALASFIQTHTALPLAKGPIEFVNEGIFASIQRMRTLMPVTGHGKHPNAATLELRGEWAYPRMMMNDCQAIEPDPPVIIVRDASGGVVVRLKPANLEEVEAMLARDVFDLPNVQARIDESRHAAVRKDVEVKRKAFLAQKRVELDARLREAVVEAIDAFGEEIDALARKIETRLNSHTFQLHTDVDEFRTVPALDAFADGGVATVAREVERRVCGALVQRAVEAVE
jgi:hypothetical protein